MKRLYQIGFVVLLLMGCAEKQVPQPANLIPKARMVEILYDIAILDAIDGTYPNSLKNNDISVMDFVYEKYGIDSLQLAASDLYYASRPVEYEQIYMALESRVANTRDSINEVIRTTNEKGRADLKKQQADKQPE